MGTAGSGAFSGESSFFPGTAGVERGVTPLTPKLPLEMPAKKHWQGTDRISMKIQSRQFQNTGSEEKSNHSTPLLSHDAVPKPGALLYLLLHWSCSVGRRSPNGNPRELDLFPTF